jgi:hypothetical protein
MTLFSKPPKTIFTRRAKTKDPDTHGKEEVEVGERKRFE